MADNPRMGGWVLFAGVMMFLVGAASAIVGLVAIFNPTAVAQLGNTIIVTNIKTAGWIHLILGILVVFAGIGVLGNQTWARMVGIFLVALNLIDQVIALNTHPAWSIVVIALDVVVIYALAVYNDPYTE